MRKIHIERKRIQKIRENPEEHKFHQSQN